MRTTLILVSFVLVLLGFSTVSAQVTPPPGSGDKSIGDNDIKLRSNELERIKRDAEKKPGDKDQKAAVSSEKFQAIKEDFENIQRLQDEIIKMYSMGKKINYEKIAQNAEQLNKSAARLESNLFPVDENKKSAKKTKEVEPRPAPSLPTDVKSLIVEQDNTLASFVGNHMFTNPQIVNTADNAKAHSDLRRLITLSAALRQEAGKLASER